MIDGAEIEKVETRLRQLAALLAHSFRLPKHTIEIRPLEREYGICHHDGEIHICVTNANHTRLLKWETILDTLAHELAHLVHFDHSQKHRRLTIAMKEWAKRNGY